MPKFEDIPEELRLSYYMGDIVIRDSFAEHEARVLWNTLHQLDLVIGRRPEMFGRLLPALLVAFKLPQVPDELREIALPLIESTQKWHGYRRDMVHDLLTMRWGRKDEVVSALGKHPSRPMKEIVECATELRTSGYRLRGLYIVTPYWLRQTGDGWDDAAGLRSWTRVAMGHIADVPNSILGAEGPAPEPPGGWDEIVAAAVAARETEVARLDLYTSVIGENDDDGDSSTPPRDP